jgi:predicted metal-dependent phosphotriesterase family hydrolase
MREYLQKLQEAGFSDNEIESMAIKTPKALLGI